MRRNPEHPLPQADQPLKNSDEALRARRALVRLEYHFKVPSIDPTESTSEDSERELCRAVEVYSSLSVAVAQLGMEKREREQLIKDGLRDESLIDKSSPYREDIEYRIIAEGYDLNRAYWNKKLGLSNENT